MSSSGRQISFLAATSIGRPRPWTMSPSWLAAFMAMSFWSKGRPGNQFTSALMLGFCALNLSRCPLNTSISPQVPNLPSPGLPETASSLIPAEPMSIWIRVTPAAAGLVAAVGAVVAAAAGLVGSAGLGASAGLAAAAVFVGAAAAGFGASAGLAAGAGVFVGAAAGSEAERPLRLRRAEHRLVALESGRQRDEVGPKPGEHLARRLDQEAVRRADEEDVERRQSVGRIRVGWHGSNPPDR